MVTTAVPGRDPPNKGEKESLLPKKLPAYLSPQFVPRNWRFLLRLQVHRQNNMIDNLLGIYINRWLNKYETFLQKK